MIGFFSSDHGCTYGCFIISYSCSSNVIFFIMLSQVLSTGVKSSIASSRRSICWEQ